MAAEILVTKELGLVTITLNRPEKLNAINKEMLDDLSDTLDVLETDRSCRVLILTGSGKAFCVGADLKERQTMSEKDVLNRFERAHHIFSRLESLSKPVVCAINGIALGGGLEISLACDLRVTSETAILGLPEVDLGIIPGSGGTQRLPRLIGSSKALELILMAQRISGKEAYEYGIVNKCVATTEAVYATAKEWALKMLEGAPLSLAAAKKAVRLGMEQSLLNGLKIETDCYKKCLYSKDRLEGLKAFSEKRKPNYTGE